MIGRHIIALLNEKKASIDGIQENISSIAEIRDETVSTESSESQQLKLELDTSKKEYRALFSEMQLCKDQVWINYYLRYYYVSNYLHHHMCGRYQIREMTDLKQRSLNSLVSAFEEYTLSTA